MIFLKVNVQMSDTSFLFCLQRNARTLWKLGANAVETQCIRQECRASAVKTSCKRHETPPKTPQKRGRMQCDSVATHWTRRGRREDAMASSFSQINFNILTHRRGNASWSDRDFIKQMNGNLSNILTRRYRLSH